MPTAQLLPRTPNSRLLKHKTHQNQITHPSTFPQQHILSLDKPSSHTTNLKTPTHTRQYEAHSHFRHSGLLLHSNLCRAHRIRSLSSWLLSCRHGLLHRGWLHLGSHTRCFCTSINHRLQRRFWYLLCSMCQDRSLRPDAVSEDENGDWKWIAGWRMEL
jgi:hypothetical protein